MPEATLIDVKCSKCSKVGKSKQAKNGSPKLPRGWQRMPDTMVVCDKCWDKSFVLRAVTFPVAGPHIAGGPKEREEAWKELRTDLHQAWSDTTRVSNWYIRELAKAEPPRKSTDKKLAAAPNPYLYNEARALCPSLTPSSVASVLSSVARKYKERRYDAIWRCAESLPSFRYPTPYPLPAIAWTPKYGNDNVPVVSLLVAAGKRIELRLRGGQEFKRQLAAFRLMVEGKCKLCELAIIEKRASNGDHRPGINTSGVRRSVMVKLVAWVPRKAAEGKSGELIVRTSGDDGQPQVAGVEKRPTFWSYFVSGSQEVKHFNADHVRRWIAEYNNRLARTNDDLKHEKRWPKEVRDKMVDSREPWVTKQRRRIDTFIHEATTMLAKFAERQRVASVSYNDNDISVLPFFPWYTVAERLRWKLNERGIELVVAAPEKASKENCGESTPLPNSGKASSS